jgi:hemolysin III
VSQEGVAALRVKPRLRGVSHEIAAAAFAVAGVWLVRGAAEGRATVAAAVYALSLVTLFGVSALYHVPTWAPGPRAFLRRCDHAAIFVLIAGTYTPVCLLAFDGDALLTAVWGVAALGIALELLWPAKPRWVLAGLCVAMGWALAAQWGAVSAGVGPDNMKLLAYGGAAYTLGAVAYAAKRPDPFPRVFGYHEIFHALTIVAAVLHFIVVARLVSP